MLLQFVAGWDGQALAGLTPMFLGWLDTKGRPSLEPSWPCTQATISGR